MEPKIKDNKKFIKSLSEGLMAYLLYLSKCRVSIAYSEYLFYEPFARMVNFKNEYSVKSEFPLKKVIKKGKSKKGDHKKIDFVLFGTSNSDNEIQSVIAIEIKYTKVNNKKGLDIEKDIIKLKSFDKEYARENRKVEKYIFLIGEYSNDSKVAEKEGLKLFVESKYKAVNSRNYIVRVYSV
jgi:hypothetical protein